MTIFYYRDAEGSYVGGFDAEQPGLIRCEPPSDGRMIFDEAQAAWCMPPAADPVSRRSMRLAEIDATADALLAGGAPVTDGLHIALDDGSRADLTAMAATATAAANGAVTWPASYSRGWISVENVRIPLPVPAAGLALAAVVGDWYARVVQHRRDLKDQVLAAVDVDALDAIDITAGWPA